MASVIGAGGGVASSSSTPSSSSSSSSSTTTPIHIGPGGMKRTVSGEASPASNVEYLEVTPLGAGCEVGRSCHILRYKGKTIMLDCGVLPSFQGIEALPLIQEVNPAEIDIIFITHFHLDHCAALPHFTERMTGFRGRIFATHATIAVMSMVLQDFVRVTTIQADDPNALYDMKDISSCLSKIEAIDLRQKINVDGVQFLLFNAGHVLGAAMILMEIAGVRILYTGDYSCEEDRHLMAAEIPRDFPPNVLIVEATFGMQVHESREQRERRFTQAVETIVKRGGRALIPVFALGRAQELLLILEEYWAANPQLRHIPIYHASGKLAAKSLDVYRTYLSAMNARVQRQAVERNPWDFQYATDISPSEFKDTGPCVVMAAPGMLQSGFSRQLFDKWCEDPKNGVILAGYSQEGTLARSLELNPIEVESASKRKLIRRCAIERVSFAAHADSVQTAAFVEALKPGAIILVHGEKHEMKRLHTTLSRRYETAAGFRGVYMPRNNEAVKFRFQEEKVIRLIGKLAEKGLIAGARVSGILVHHDFETLFLAPSEVSRFTQLATHTLVQKLHVPYRSSFAMLKAFVTSMYADTVESVASSGSSSSSGVSSGKSGTTTSSSSSSNTSIVALNTLPGFGDTLRKTLIVAGGIVTLIHNPPDRVIVTWSASPVADMIADSLVAVIAQAEVSIVSIKATSKPCGHDHGGGNGEGAVKQEEGVNEGGGAGGLTEQKGGMESEMDILPNLMPAVATSTPPISKAALLLNNHLESSPFSDSLVNRVPDAATTQEMIDASEWAGGVPWARNILLSDSGPFRDTDIAGTQFEIGTRGGGGGEQSTSSSSSSTTSADVSVGSTLRRPSAMTTPTATPLPPPTKRRKELLLRVLRDQYGSKAVEELGKTTGVGGDNNHTALSVLQPDFRLRVHLDDKAGDIVYSSTSGFAVERVTEGKDEKIRLGAALERAAELVDTLFSPVHKY